MTGGCLFKLYNCRVQQRVFDWAFLNRIIWCCFWRCGTKLHVRVIYIIYKKRRHANSLFICEFLASYVDAGAARRLRRVSNDKFPTPWSEFQEYYREYGNNLWMVLFNYCRVCGARVRGY